MSAITSAWALRCRSIRLGVEQGSELALGGGSLGTGGKGMVGGGPGPSLRVGLSGGRPAATARIGRLTTLSGAVTAVGCTRCNLLPRTSYRVG